MKNLIFLITLLLTLTVTAQVLRPGAYDSIEANAPGGAISINSNININSTVEVDGVLDEDTMVSDSATSLVTQQSVKAYADSLMTTIDNLTDVTITAPSTGEVLTWDGAKWVNSAPAGGGGGVDEWVTLTVYSTGDIVHINDLIYIADSDHTAGVFATDLAAGLWREMSLPHGTIDIESTKYDNTGFTPAAHVEGEVWYDNVRGALTVEGPYSGSPIKVGQEMHATVRNISGTTITKGKVVYLSGTDSGLPTIDLSSNATEAQSTNTIGLVHADIANNSNGIVIFSGVVEGIDTSTWAAGDALYISSTPGVLTNVKPSSPAWATVVAYALDSAVSGKIGVRVAPNGNDEATANFFNGTFLSDWTADIITDGGVGLLYEIEKAGGGDIYIYKDGEFALFDTTPAATVALTLGTDLVPQINYIYVDLTGTPTLTANTTGWPTTAHGPVATVIVGSQATTLADGPMKDHAWVNHLSSDDTGHINHINKWIRNQHATWLSGVAPTFTGSGTTSVTAAFTSGSGLQLHEHSFDAQTDPADMIVVNDPTGYVKIDNLNDILTDSTGTTITNQTFSLVFWGALAENTGDSKVYVNLPGCSYGKGQPDLVRSDLDGCTNYTIPEDFKGTGFLIHRMVVDKSPAGVYTIYSGDGDDLRGTLPNTAAGGSTSVGTDFPDSLFSIYDTDDDSKILNFDVGGITTATTRTFTAPDDDGTIALATGVSGGQTIYGSDQASENLTLDSTSNATKGLVQIPNSDLNIGTPVAADQGEVFRASRSDSTGWVGLFEGTTGYTGFYQFGLDGQLRTSRNLTIDPDGDLFFSIGGFNWGGVDDVNGWAFGYGLTAPPTANKLVTIRGKTSNDTADALYITDSSNNELFSVRNDGKITARSGAIDGNLQDPSVYALWDAEDDVEPSVLGWTDSGGGESAAVNDTTPLEGDHDYLIQLAASGEYVRTEAISLDQINNVAHQTHALKFTYYYPTTDDEITVSILDQSNNVISDPLILVGKALSHPAEILFDVTSSVTSVKVEFKSTSYTGANSLYIDKMYLDYDAFSARDIKIDQNISVIKLGSAMTATGTGVLRWGTLTSDTGEDLFEYDDTTGKFTALKDCTVSVHASLHRSTGTVYYYAVKNATTPSSGNYFAYSGNDTTQSMSGSDYFSAGDYFVIYGNGATGTADTQVLTIHAQADASHVARQEERQQAHTVASVHLQGTDGRTITASTEDVYFSGSGTGWTSSGDNNYYTIQEDDSIIELSVAVAESSAVDRDLYLFLDTGSGFAFYKTLHEMRSTSYSTVNTGAYISGRGEFSKGNKLAIRVGATITLTTSTGNNYLTINEHYVPPLDEANVITTVLLPQSEENNFTAYIDSADDSVSRENADWINGNASDAGGTYTLTLTTNFFSQPPNCHCAIEYTDDDFDCDVSSTSTTTVVAETSIGTSGTLSSTPPFTIYCDRQGSDYKGTRVHVGSVPRNQVMYIDIHATNYKDIVTSSTSYKTINLESLSGEIFGSINLDQLTLPAGKYEVLLPVGAYGNSAYIDARIQNISDTTTIEEFLEVAYSASTYTIHPTPITTTFELSAPKTIEFQTRADNVSAWEAIFRIKITKLND